MSTKQELVDQIIAMVIADGSSVGAEQRMILERQTVTWLESKLSEMQTALHEKQRQEAMKKAEGILESRREAARINAEREADWIESQVQHGMEIEAERRAERARKEPKARELFALICRNHNLSLVEANFRLLFEADLLDSENEADQTIASGAVALAPAQPHEIAMYQQERLEGYNQELLNASHDQLKRRTREDSEQKRIATQQAQADDALAVAQARDQARGRFHQFPADITGEQIRNVAPSKLKLWIKKYGIYQINARLRGTA